MSKKQNIYWVCQFVGWASYVAINLFFFGLSYSTDTSDILNFLLWLPLGISITHLYRYTIIKLHILKLKLYAQIPIILVAAFLMATMFFTLNIGIVRIFNNLNYEIDLIAAFTKILNVFPIFVVWSVLYFGFHFFDNYKKTEIQNLRLEATSKEIELNKLKSQLNPHFMFNSMNSIRALIDEDPQKAKVAVTQLSTILRNTLMMHKNKFISLEEELALVKDYLELEHIRFEERLRYTFDIDPQTLSQNVPPMMIQTLVENGIKHGISKFPEGGDIFIKTSRNNQTCNIQITNSGQLNSANKTDSGFGIENTTNRLGFLYGTKASFSIRNLDTKHVLSEIIINN